MIAEAVSAFFNESRNQELLERLETAAGLNPVEPKAAKADGPLSGKTYVLTGSLPTLSRSQATSLIEEAGGRVGGQRQQEDRLPWSRARTPGASWRRRRRWGSRSSTRRSSCEGLARIRSSRTGLARFATHRVASLPP